MRGGCKVNWTEEEYKEFLKKRKNNSSSKQKMSIAEYKEYLKKEDSKSTKKTKYRNKKKTVDDIVFHSTKEADYYCYLKIQLQQKKIIKFELQPHFELQAKYKRKDGKKIREIEYISDFMIWHLDGSIEVVDTKGYETKDFKIKRKLFEAKYPDIKFTVI